MIDADAIFFDIGGTLAEAHLSDIGRLVSLEPLPGVRDVLVRISAAGYRLGLISNTGEETGATIRKALTEAGLFSFFAGEPELLIYSSEVHMEKDSPEIFRLACRRAGLDARPERCLFVGDDERERQFASEAGMQVADGPQALAE